MKLCSDCRYLKYDAWCVHPKALKGEWVMDYVHAGKKVWVSHSESFCTSTEMAFRMRNGECGSEGAFWEQRPPTWLERIFRHFNATEKKT